MARYKFHAYFNHSFIPIDTESRKLILNRRPVKKITRFAKESIQSHRSEMTKRGFGTIKFHCVEMLFEDRKTPPLDVYRVILEVTDKKQSTIKLVDTISNECNESLREEFPGIRIVPGRTRIRTIR